MRSVGVKIFLVALVALVAGWLAGSAASRLVPPMDPEGGG